jgi:hypothetical protein
MVHFMDVCRQHEVHGTRRRLGVAEVDGVQLNRNSGSVVGSVMKCAPACPSCVLARSTTDRAVRRRRGRL